MALATPSALGMGDYSWRFSLGGSYAPNANWAAARLPINGGFGAALTAADAPAAPKGVFDKGDLGGEGGAGSIGSGTPSSGPSAGGLSGVGMSGQPDFETGRTVRNIGRALSLVAPAPIGMAIGAIGTLADIETANKALTARGFDKIDTLSAMASMLGLGTAAEDQYTQSQGFGLGAAVEIDDMVQGAQLGGMGFGDDFGGWGGYGGQANQGPGADIESEPGGLSQDDIDAIDSFDSWDTDMANAADNFDSDEEESDDPSDDRDDDNEDGSE